MEPLFLANPFYCFQLALLLIWLTGIVLAIARWPQHREVSLLIIIAFLLFMVQEVLTLVIAPASRSLAYPLLILRLLMKGIAWALLLVALFNWRPPQGRGHK